MHMTKTLYLAGPMRGYPFYNFPAFKEAAERLREGGWDVFNPAEHDLNNGFDPSKPDSHEPLAHYLAHDLPEVCRRDAIAVLPGWEESEGARIEVHVATALGKLLLDARTGFPVERPNILSEAEKLVLGARQASYGHPVDDFCRTAGMWRALFGWEVEPHHVPMAMIAVKLSRATESPDKRDHWVDIAGYAQCAEMTVGE
jgi:hypothetical protein